MAANDDAQILQVPLKLNAVLRQMQEQVFKLNGRTGDAAIRSGLGVTGGVTSGGSLTGSALTLGTAGLTPSNPSFAPTVESALAPVALDYAPLLGARADALAVSPFTWHLSDHFLGGEPSTSGNVGSLGWTFTGALAYLGSEASHPGFVNIADTGALYLQNFAVQGDVSYFAAVLRLNEARRINFKAGLINPGAPGTTGAGAYFYIDSSSNPVWSTATVSSSGTSLNSSTVSVVNGDWVLLEIVLTTTTADFYLDRERMFRHTGVSVEPANNVYFGFEQSLVVSPPDVDYDRFVAAGRGTDKIWS
jgi:hypothetical protein